MGPLLPRRLAHGLAEHALQNLLPICTAQESMPSPCYSVYLAQLALQARKELYQMAPPSRQQIPYAGVAMVLPDRVGRLKSRLDNAQDMHVQDVYATQSTHAQMNISLDDRFAEDEAILLY